MSATGSQGRSPVVVMLRNALDLTAEPWSVELQATDTPLRRAIATSLARDRATSHTAAIAAQVKDPSTSLVVAGERPHPLPVDVTVEDLIETWGDRKGTEGKIRVDIVLTRVTVGGACGGNP